MKKVVSPSTHRIIKCSDLEGTHNDQVQLLTPHGTNYSIYPRMLSKHFLNNRPWPHLWVVCSSDWPPSQRRTSSKQQIWTSPHAALSHSLTSYHQTPERRDQHHPLCSPSLGCCRQQLLSLLFSKLNKPGVHSCSSQALPSCPFHHLCCLPLNTLITSILFI